MACPQKENGHLRIANEVWDHLASTPLLGSEFQVVMAVIRKTWGWGSKEKEISLPDFCSITGQPERKVARALSSLRQRNILLRTSGGGRGNASKWTFNKDWEKWKTLSSVSGNINPDKINSVLNDREDLTPVTGFTTTDVRVSPCNLFETQENEPPKDTLKDNINTTTPSEVKRDLAYDFFAAQFERKTGTPYMDCKGDFVQLARLRKSFKVGGKEMPPDWEEAVSNYLDSPANSYSISYMVTGNRYAIFRKSKVNQFGKPETTTVQKTSKLADDYEKAHYNPCARG